MRRGKVELATVRSLASMARLHPAHEALAASALVLARALDEGAGLATAAVARQHAAILTALAEGGGGDSNDAVADLLARMSAPVGDASPS